MNHSSLLTLKIKLPVYLPKRPVFTDLRFHKEARDFLAKASKVGSPNNLLKIPNSNKTVPAPAVQVSL